MAARGSAAEPADSTQTPLPQGVSVADRIRRGMPALTPTERRVARVLLASYPAAGLGTVADLAGDSGTSSASVVRLVQKLGFDGYPQFQAELRDELARRTTGPAERVASAQDVWERPGILGRTTAALARTVAGVADTVPESEFEAAVALLSDPSRPVHLMGGRISRLFAEYLEHHLGRLRKNVTLFPADPSRRHSTVLDLTRRDVFVAFDLRRYDRASIEAATLVAGRGATIVLITDVLMSPIASLASTVLPVRVDAPSPFDTAIGVLALVEALSAAAMAGLGPPCLERMRAWDTLAEGELLT